MTPAQLLAVLRRRWYIPMIGALCFIMITAGSRESNDVYFAQTEVVFEEPGVPVVSGFNSGYSESLTHFAALVERAVNAETESVRLSSPTATLFGIGIRKGRSIVLSDRGGQWSHVFDRPVLQIQVVDLSPGAVEREMSAAIKEIDGIASTLQLSSGAPAEYRIKVTTNKDGPQIIAFGQTSEGWAKGMVAMAAAVFGLTAAAACTLDRSVSGWSRVRSPESKGE